MTEIEERLDEFRAAARTRYIALVTEALDSDHVPDESELRSALSDVGKTLADFETDVKRGKARYAAIAKLMEADELAEQLPQLQARIAPLSEAYNGLRRKHEEEFAQARRALSAARGAFDEQCQEIERMRKEARITLQASCPPRLVTRMLATTKQMHETSGQLAAAQGEAEPKMLDPREDVAEQQQKLQQMAGHRAMGLEAQLKGLQKELAEINAQIFSDDPHIIVA